VKPFAQLFPVKHKRNKHQKGQTKACTKSLKVTERKEMEIS